MVDLYREPVLYGIDDVTVSGEGGTFGMRIYYPSEEGSVFGVPIRPGTYPLVVFAHGQREARGTDSESLLFGPEPGCPEDSTLDHRRWSAVLHLLARCGFVVAAPALSDVIDSSEISAARLEAAIQWMRWEWEHRVVLWGRELFLDPDSTTFRQAASAKSPEGYDLGQFGVRHLGEGVGARPVRPGMEIILPGMSTNLGLAGHSWGARACARVAVRGQVRVEAIASIAGSWDESEAISALIGARDPTLLMAGTLDQSTLSYLPALWGQLVRPKHQAAFQGVGHWDWFGTEGGIQYCDPENRPRCGSVAWSTASEMLTGFMTKYLYNRWRIPPYLLGERFTDQPWGFSGSMGFPSYFALPRSGGTTPWPPIPPGRWVRNRGGSGSKPIRGEPSYSNLKRLANHSDPGQEYHVAGRLARAGGP
jgi:hypothetical protein